MNMPLMRKATAVWLVDNTTLTFKQIAEFCGLHELEVNGIADGEVAQGIKGMDPIANRQLSEVEIKRCEKDPKARLQLMVNPAAEGEERRRGPRYTPLSKRQDRPSAIAWLVKFHPELSDGQIGKLIGTTKPTIQAIRNRSHWNISNIQPVDPVALGLCKQTELDAAVGIAQAKLDKAGIARPQPEGLALVSTDESLSMRPEARLPSNVAGLENFRLMDDEEDRSNDPRDQADALFNLPDDDDDD